MSWELWVRTVGAVVGAGLLLWGIVLVWWQWRESRGVGRRGK